MDINKIMAFEDGMLSEEDIIKMFQEMIDDGSVWGLQGCYGRVARTLIKEGRCTHAPVRHKDFYGNVIPSKADAEAKSKPDSKKYVELLRIIREDSGMEQDHIDADKVLCSLLISLGYKDVVDEYNKIEKYYA